MVKISVIVPIYNVEAWLPQCIESLQNQTLRDLEILLVDDGSTDDGGKLADAYVRKDSRIRVIHQENAGLGPARNAGLAMARGAFVAFVDGDDWVKPDMYEKLYAAAERSGADIVVSGHRDMAFGRCLVRKVHPLAGTTVSGEAIGPVRARLYGLLPEEGREAFPMSVCMSLYRREMLWRNHIRFQNLLSEDTLFNLDAYGCARVITFSDQTDYCYRKEGQSSITASFSWEKLGEYREFLSTLLTMAEADGCLLRGKRTAVDCCRLYAGQLEMADWTLTEKRRCLKAWIHDPVIRKYWMGYPIEQLPAQQRLFHSLLEKEYFTAALVLLRLRRWSRKGGILRGKL